MKYATWKLKFDDPKYGIGPEDKINAQGFHAEGAEFLGDVGTGAKVVGYFTGNPTSLESWDFEEITQSQALQLVQTVNPDAYLLEDGTITAPVPERPDN